MHAFLRFSPWRVACSLAIALVVAVPCALAIFYDRGSARPLIELPIALAAGAVVSMVAPQMLKASRRDAWGAFVRRPLKSHFSAVLQTLLAPRRLQFSVRAGLIYLTAVCLWLGLAVNRIHTVRSAARTIELAGGRVSYASPGLFRTVRNVGIARRGGPWDDATIRRLIPAIRTLNPRRIVVGALASEEIVAELEAAFPSTEVSRTGPPRG